MGAHVAHPPRPLAAALLALGLAAPSPSAHGQAGTAIPVAVTDAELVRDARVLDVAEGRRIIDHRQSWRCLSTGSLIVRAAIAEPVADCAVGGREQHAGDLDALDAAKSRREADHFIGALSHMFETGRSQQDGRTLAPRARAGAGGQSFGARAVAATFWRAMPMAQADERWRARYGRRKLLLRPNQKKAAPALFPALAVAGGQAGWSFNGVHTTSGSCNPTLCASPQSSIDFSRGWPVGHQYDQRVHARRHGGNRRRLSSCNVRATNANGWATNYYHLANVGVTNGATVVTGQRLADYADNQAQSCLPGRRARRAART